MISVFAILKLADWATEVGDGIKGARNISVALGYAPTPATGPTGEGGGAIRTREVDDAIVDIGLELLGLSDLPVATAGHSGLSGPEVVLLPITGAPGTVGNLRVHI